eukprot:gene7276-biopygen9063
MTSKIAGDFANLAPCPCVGPRGPGPGAGQGDLSDYYFLGPCIRDPSDYYFLGADRHLRLPPACKADLHPSQGGPSPGLGRPCTHQPHSGSGVVGYRPLPTHPRALWNRAGLASPTREMSPAR